MFFILGIIIVVASVITGYLMHFGDLSLLWQPNEILIIIGAAIGATLIAIPRHLLWKSLKSLAYLFRGQPYNRKDYLELLLFFFQLTRLLKSKGMVAAEVHLDNPQQSSIFRQVQAFRKPDYPLNFICDNFRLISMGVDRPQILDEMLDSEITVFENNEQASSRVFLTIGDALPALGIVAAVLGIIITMRSILEPPEVLGSMIAAALVGTFTGVLLAYGLVNPIGHFLSKYVDEQVRYLECIKIGLIAYVYGSPSMIIIELMRKSIPAHLKPSFSEVDQVLRNQTLKIAEVHDTQ